MEIDLLIRNVIVFNSYCKKFIASNIAIMDGKFLYIGNGDIDQLHPSTEIDGEGRYLIPGLIDIHMHIESSMAAPREFSHELIKNGVTTIVAEPHEIANIFGLEGIDSLLKASEGCVVDIFLGIPSSVPSTSSQLETTGCEIGIGDVEKLLQTDRVICLGEVMNYMDVIYSPHSKTNQIINYIKEKIPHMPIEGHCPKIVGLELARFIYAGVDSDHTQQTLVGLKERLLNGMFIEIQEKSVTKEIVTFLVENAMYEHFAFVTDDVMADSLVQEGHLNKNVKKAIQLGMTPENAIYAATFTPARRMGLKDRGSIAPGKRADFILLDNLEDFAISCTYKDGLEVFNHHVNSEFTTQAGLFPQHFYNSVNLPMIDEDCLQIKTQTKEDSVTCRIIKVADKTTFTQEVFANLEVHEGLIDWEKSAYCLVAVFERYGKNHSIGLGLVTGDVIKHGAVATTYAHDHHNLLVIGRNKKDMVLAVNNVIGSQGGYCVIRNGKILGKIDLPVAGILSEAPMSEIGKQVAIIKKAMKELGYHHYNPIMSLSTLSLPVSPQLKITNKGLVNVREQKIVEIIVENHQ